jgi:hypothetical protein
VEGGVDSSNLNEKVTIPFGAFWVRGLFRFSPMFHGIYAASIFRFLSLMERLSRQCL